MNAAWWLDTWSRRRGWAMALWPISLLYATLWHVLRWWHRLGFKRVSRLPVPVLVVGNVFVGGTGKTPITIELVRQLRDRGWHPGVVSKGHGRTNQNLSTVSLQSNATEVGDEPLLIHRLTQAPVVVAKDRHAAALALLARHPEVDLVLCDDGLQHLGLPRDVELCVFDARRIGNGWVFPAGPLREPWPRQVEPGVTALNLSSEQPPWDDAWGVHRQMAPQAHNGLGDTLELRSLTQPVHALAAIAQPEAFFSALRAAGITLSQAEAHPDHATLEDWHPPAASVCLCTEKDAVKVWPRHPKVWAVPLSVQIDPACIEVIDQALRSRLSSRHGQQTV